MAQFHKRPKVYEAEQWFPGKDVDGVVVPSERDVNALSWLRYWLFGKNWSPKPGEPYLESYLGPHCISPGDWVVSDGGDRALCRPELFDKFFVPAHE